MMTDAQIIELDAIAAVKAIRERAFTVERYAKILLERCVRLARLNAFIEIDRSAVLKSARDADAALATGRPAGPLHGVLIAVKDNIDVAGLPATAGTPALRDNRPDTDASLVALLREAGAIVLGKANMHELAAGITTDNPVFGTARNPHNESHVPGGSSGGTAVAVSARLAPIGIGTDTGASNRLPAAFCGIVGFRPTTGRWPNDGLILNSPTRDTAGPMARTVEDCALIDAIVTGQHDPLKPVDLRELRLGLPRGYFWNDLDPAIASLSEDWLARLREAGVTLVEADIPELGELTALAGLPIGVFEHEAALSAYLEQAGSSLTFADVLAAIESPDVKAFLTEVRQSISEHDYRVALDEHRPRLQQAYESYIRLHKIDAILFPTSPLLAPKIEETQDATGEKSIAILIRAIRNTDPGSIAGIPGISLPGGISPERLPVGLELDGPAGADRRLLAIAAAIAPLMPSMPVPSLT